MDILQCINNIESKFPVSTWKVGDIDVWPIVRLGLVYENMVTESDNYYHTGNIFSTLLHELKMLLLCLYVTISDYRHHVSEHKTDVVFWGVNMVRTIRLSTGVLADQNLDMIKLELEKRGYGIYSLEYLSTPVTKFPRYTSSDMGVYWKIFKARCSSKLRRNKEDIFFPQFNEVKYYLKENGFRYSTCDKSNIDNNVNSIKGVAECFYNILERTEAKMGVVICWYWSLSMSFALACRKRGIPCVDIQHGIAGGNKHEAYYNWINTPTNGYNIMPTNFWCWSDKDAEAINEWFCSEHSDIKSAFVGGNYTQLYLLKNDLGSLWNRRLVKNVENKKYRVLVTLQPGFKLPEWFVEFIRTSEDIQWYIRMHPSMDVIQREFIDKVKDINCVEYAMASACPLCSVLDICHLNVTSHSSVVVDAEPYGVKSVIIDEEGLKYFQGNIARGECFYADNVEEFNEIIKHEMAGVKTNEEKIKQIDMSGIDNLIRLIEQ